jgi:hypothetical protein
MAGFTLPEEAGEGNFYAGFPLFTLIDTASVPGKGLVQIVGYTHPCIPLYTEEDHARQAIGDLNMAGVVPHPVPDAAALIRLLTGASAATGATHVALDVGNRFAHGTGRVRTVREFLDAVAAGDAG